MEKGFQLQLCICECIKCLINSLHQIAINHQYVENSAEYPKEQFGTFFALILAMLGHFNIFSDRLAIDPGTDRTLLYTAKMGIVINEHSVVAVGVNGKSQPHIVAVGEEAGNMLGKTPPPNRSSPPRTGRCDREFRGHLCNVETFYKDRILKIWMVSIDSY